jgi:hypothetical protein
MSHLAAISSYLRKPVSPAPLTTLRVVTGLVMFIGTLRFYLLGWIEENVLAARIQFKYTGFEWIQMPQNPIFLYVIFGIILASSLGVMLGYRYRLSAWLLFLSFTYVELLDITWYLNHYYFISLLLFLLAALPAHKHLSLDVYLQRTKPVSHIPTWMMALPRVQMALLYIFAGIAKIQSDWLIEALPMKIWLPAHSEEPVLGPLFAWTYTPWIFSWIGMVYDCSIPFWLSFKKTRPWAYFTVIVFHALTGWLFQIGMFPVVMIGITLVFFDADIHLKFQKKLFKKHAYVQGNPYRPISWAFPLTLVYVGIQLILPLRFLTFPGKLFWTESGYRFSWRVMLMEKAGTATFYVTRGDTHKEGIIDNSDFLLPHQEKQMAMQPDLIVQFAHRLKEHFEEANIPIEKVRAEVYVTLQGKPSTLYFDPQRNLLELNHRHHPHWLNPAP